MKDYLMDIVKNTMCMGQDVILKITGDDSITLLKAKRDDGSLILEATLNKPVVFDLRALPPTAMLYAPVVLE